ncbi:MAG: preprotein translocase subunit SecG [Lachnospiraceae bacterium]|nr:preprotein translocase subunit SecG [Lachnospiraceae bacterium]
MLATIKTVLTIVYILVCVALSVIVLMQEGKDAGLSALTGGASGGSDTYWSKNKGRSAEGALKKGTAALAVLFIVLSVVLNLKLW